MRTLAILLILAAAPSSVEWERDYGGWLPGTEPDDLLAVLVTDAVTGLPLPGVHVRQYPEDAGDDAPPAPLLGRAVTDEFGLAALPARKDETCHWVFDKPGYAVETEYVKGRYPPGEVDLAPGRTFRGRILDSFGDPSVGTPVELFLGCGHSPAVRRALTDREGRFRMADVDSGILWISAGDLAATYRHLRRPVGEEEQVFVYPPGLTVRGTVTDAEGKPWPGVTVRGFNESGRGPKTWTDRAGRFVLVGVDTYDGVHFYSPGWGARAIVSGDGFDPDLPLRVVLREGEDPDEGRFDEGAEDVVYRARVVDAETGDPVPGLPVNLTRVEDGRVFYDVTGERGEPAEVCAPPGRYRASADDWDGSHDAGPREVRVVPDDEAVHVMPARRRPVLEATYRGVPDEARMQLVIPGHDRWWDADSPDTPHLHADVRAALRVTHQGVDRFYPVGPAKDGVRRVEVVWPEVEPPPERPEEPDPEPPEPSGSATLEIRIGEEIDFRVSVDGRLDVGEAGRLVFDRLEAGPHVLVVAAKGRRSRALRVVLGEGAKRRLDVGLEPR